MKIYTRSGDLGTTSLFGGQRVPKHHQRLNAYGTVDELNAALGWVVSLEPEAETVVKIQRIQSELMSLSSDLATPLDVKNALIQRMQAPEIRQLESEIDAWDA
ncbi:MAG: ATP:cob(I)alamin adenosyltransferase, partial [Chloroflexi bacterium]|nr:ATP:cob(I)alamin adenosyltransferase [Chloroflexota bacterium]